MKQVLIYPAYFAPIECYALLLQGMSPVFEVCDHFQKQTYRTRCYVTTSNGKQALYVPVRHTKSGYHKFTRQTQIDYTTEDWRKQHLKTLSVAYRSSPFFEFYEDDIYAIFGVKYKFLLDLNMAIHRFVMEALQEPIRVELSVTKTYEKNTQILDFRSMVNPKSKKYFFQMTPYTQLFSNKNGFLSNLSILDLLFMQGPSSSTYLRSLVLMNHKTSP